MSDISEEIPEPPTYSEINKERIKQVKAKWREKNRDSIKASAKKWREANKEKVSKQKKEYYSKTYYKNQLLKKFTVIKDEILIGNDSEELLEELKEIVEELNYYKFISEEEYNNIINLI